MRVLIVTGSFPPARCGVGHYSSALARSLAQLPDVEVGILTDAAPESRPPDDTACADAGVEVLRRVHGWRLRRLGATLRAIREWQPDVVHVQYPTQGYDGALATWLPAAVRWKIRVPVVETLHEYLAARFRVPVQMLLPARHFIVVRPRFREHMRRWFRWLMPEHRVSLIRNAAAVPRVSLSDGDVIDIRTRFGAGNRALITFFGFLYPRRGVDQLFRIADPAKHHLLIVGEPHPEFPEYHQSLADLAVSGEWRGRASLTGFLPDSEASRVLAGSDAVVLPYVDGSGDWNTSIHSAVLQGTFVLTTDTERTGYDPVDNVYRAAPNDLDDMAHALNEYQGRRRRTGDSDDGVRTWMTVAAEHVELYRELVEVDTRSPVVG